MRFGFVAASLTAHVAVVGLAWRFAPVGERATAPRAEPSGLPSDLLEVTPWEPVTASDDVSPVGAAPATKTNETSDAANDTPLVTATPARAGAPPKAAAASQRFPKPGPPAIAGAADEAAAPEQVRAPRQPANERPSGGDWMTLDDQLPDPGTDDPTEDRARTTPERDVLVERLLAKERDKARLAARDEADAHARAAGRDVAGDAKPAGSASEPQPRTPDDETFGESRAHADLWVELTRWLPRAASSDQAWEQLPSNASYEFRIELVTEAGKLVDSKLLDSAPSPTKKLLTNTSHLMERGKYAGSKRLVHRFELRIRLSTAEPRDLWIAHTTPDPPKPGVGSFIAPSGRRFDVWVSEID